MRQVFQRLRCRHEKVQLRIWKDEKGPHGEARCVDCGAPMPHIKVNVSDYKMSVRTVWPVDWDDPEPMARILGKPPS